MTESVEALVRGYYDDFNAGNFAGMVARLTPDVAHDINQGVRQTGREAFTKFMAHMDRCYRERLDDIVVMTDASGARAAAEFVVHGTYLVGDEGFPIATGQSYVLPAGAFFDIRDGLIARVSNYYNLEDWLRQVRR